MVGKFCVTVSFGILYLYTAEVFPTSVRNATLGSCSMCARVGSILAPFGKATHETVPNLLYAFLALSGSLVTLLHRINELWMVIGGNHHDNPW
ncbi:organic cation transporter protein [Caerostris darwini]|uniref:Organic cation transporter protein n=1 Tax=Caerostris darwini TaxID=1538125 RepID=A0AAV4SVS2_9ARAC|nr:organic cation transporter protein [Caerostris darwini]